jgi:transcription antitermination factor NusG
MAGKLEISRKIIIENKRKSTDSDAMNWYAIRVTYSRELKFQTLLQESGFQTFVPMCRRTFEKNGKKETKLVPAVSNLIFVHSEKADLDAFMARMGEACPARFIWDKSTRKPIVVPDKAMEDFIKISMSNIDDVIYLQEVTAKLREGQRVKVKNGPFEGVEGTVIRVKRSRRVMVELPGMMAIATTFVKPEELEIL